MKEVMLGSVKLSALLGDITGQEVDAIVNAANSKLAGGGGVDGAIHRAGGPGIMAECDIIRRKEGGCPPGRAVITTAGGLSARYVIHTVGPIWRGGGRGEPDILASCYASSIRIASENGCRTIAFPSIGTGAYRYPVRDAAGIAVSSVAEAAAGSVLEEVRFVLFSQADYETYSEALDRIET
jgi:O-acetyl-ADP-ribose deacetylase (regulator of RNase III)